MPNFEVGLSGLQVAQKALELIGTNIANASTPGYHKQEIQTAPVEYAGFTGIPLAGGVEITDVRRRLDVMLEKEYVRQQPQKGQVDQELMTLQSIEASLGTLDSDGLGTALDSFFNALSELGSEPTSQALREQVVWAGDDMARQFNNLYQVLSGIQEHVYQEGKSIIQEVNTLTDRIAELNRELQETESRKGNTNMVSDQRDQLVVELAGLLDIEQRELASLKGLTVVEGWGMPLVHGIRSFDLDLEVAGEDLIGVTPPNMHANITDVEGGRLGGIINLYNNIIPDIMGELDSLAGEITRQINRIHLQGVGSNGSYDELTGWSIADPAATFDTYNDQVVAGTIYYRVTEEATGNVRNETLSVDPTVDSLDTLRAAFDADADLSANVVGNALRISADSGYTFDFLPRPLVDTTAGPWAGPTPTVGGVYSNDANETFTLTVVSDQPPGTVLDVGTDAPLELEVSDSGGTVLARVNVGAGYAAGDRLEIKNGLTLSMPSGSLTVGQSFEILGLADTDTSNALSELGINSFFQGGTSETLQVSDRIHDDASYLAGSINEQKVDNANILRMAAIGEEYLSELDNMTPADFHRKFVTGVGQRTMVLEGRQEAMDAVENQLLRHRDDISGVDVNKEAANMILYEKMFQACAKYISVLENTVETIMGLIR